MALRPSSLAFWGKDRLPFKESCTDVKQTSRDMALTPTANSKPEAPNSTWILGGLSKWV